MNTTHKPFGQSTATIAISMVEKMIAAATAPLLEANAELTHSNRVR